MFDSGGSYAFLRAIRVAIKPTSSNSKVPHNFIIIIVIILLLLSFLLFFLILLLLLIILLWQW